MTEKKTVKTLVDLPIEVNKLVKIEGAKRGLTITDTIIAVLSEKLKKG